MLCIRSSPRGLKGHVPGQTAFFNWERANKKRINAWEKSLTPRQIEIFESIAAELLLSLGYVLQYEGRTRKMNIFEHVCQGFRKCMPESDKQVPASEEN